MWAVNERFTVRKNLKKVSVAISVFVLTFALMSATPSFAHMSIKTNGNSIKAGDSSTIWLRVGHGCKDADGKEISTTRVSVVVPREAGTPKAEHRDGWDVTLTPQGEKDSAGTYDSYLVNWQAKPGFSVAPGTFSDFGVQVKWGKTPGKIWLDGAQDCLVASSQVQSVAISAGKANAGKRFQLSQGETLIKSVTLDKYGKATVRTSVTTGDLMLMNKTKMVKATITPTVTGTPAKTYYLKWTTRDGSTVTTADTETSSAPSITTTT